MGSAKTKKYFRKIGTSKKGAMQMYFKLAFRKRGALRGQKAIDCEKDARPFLRSREGVRGPGETGQKKIKGGPTAPTERMV